MGNGFDRNTIIGTALLVVLLIGYIFIAQREQGNLQKQQQHIKDSLALHPATPAVNTTAGRADSLHLDSLLRSTTAGSFSAGVAGSEQTSILENDLVRITFSNRGGQPKIVELKKYKRFDGTPLYLVADGGQEFSYLIQTGSNAAATKDLFFSTTGVQQEGGNQVLRYTLKDSLGHAVQHEYVLQPNQYMLQLNIRIDGALQLLPQNALNATWSFTAQPQERDVTYEKRTTALSYYDQDGYDYKTLSSTGDKNLENVTWIGTKQRFFNNTLISKDNKMGASLHWEANSDSLHDLVKTTAGLQIKLPPSAGTAIIPLEWYMGPNEYHLLKTYGLHLEENVQMGNGIYAFVKYLNRWIVIPVFDFFHGFVSNFGIVILLLTFFIRLVISPLTYSSYLSGAKMRVLRPEIDELKKKYKDDQQAFGVEQMKLFRTAGVNPLGGCIPALLQIPIFFALYSFFNSNIALRGQSFLWSHDLSTYDSIFNFGFKIPFYGDHVSLFTLTAIVSSFLIQIWNMNMTPDQNNPMMKYMPYIFPVVLLGVFNGLPAGLTWYYTVSNVITLAIQLVIQKFIIDEKKIHAQLQENKKKPKAKSKWAERLEQIQETQKKVQDMKDKTQKR
ncbi:membrane protein insertase YidC [Dinghuibacter silviterrae]|uniref:Membrane protein insertase YidC n=1 Tax=Dinghuibacter silviterrae TaxID=1539049 RepID=A0A4R8DS61_9BACT|nr:membrane protein insertase YidC [Dinghuibacter silviterrae]TDX00668.1 YidC/Oxa1 family membrane protein insertase [Dinghuibacter silviterrae]